MDSIVVKSTAIAAMASYLGLAAPALADVKAGVEAWSAGEYARAVREWTPPAADGDADAQFNLAQAYRLGRGVAVDLERAADLYARAAAQGHLRAEEQYGLLLFQQGDREQAMPYIAAAAGRGDPRAQYLLGIAHFNGDLAVRDWPRAYALLTLANGAGLEQAARALAQMDEHVPLSQRQEAQSLAGTLKAEADAQRARQLAAADLAMGMPASPAPRAESSAVAPDRATDRPATAAASAAEGPWKVQLGAFGEPGNAERLWRTLSDRPELAGRKRMERPAGSLTILLAAGYGSRAEAAAACAALKRSGTDCLVTR